MKRQLLYWAAIIGLTASLASARDDDDHPAPKDTTPPLVTVQTGTLQLATLHRYVRAFGNIEFAPATSNTPAADVLVSPAVAGVITKVNLYEGQEIKKGDLLVELNSGSTTIENARRQVERQKELYAEQNTAQKNLQEAETQLSLLQVRAPMSGTVAHLNARVGQAVDLTTAVAEIMDLKRLSVTASVPAGAAPSLKPGCKIEVLTDPRARSEISYISPDVDRSNDTVLIRGLLPSDSGSRPGQFAELRIVTEVRSNCLVAPKESIVNGDDGKSVLAVVKGDEASQTKVKLGLGEGDLVEIIAPGLKAGDSIVTVGAYGLPEKTKIQIQKPAAE